jgi:hypothetical protein
MQAASWATHDARKHQLGQRTHIHVIVARLQHQPRGAQAIADRHRALQKFKQQFTKKRRVKQDRLLVLGDSPRG